MGKVPLLLAALFSFFVRGSVADLDFCEEQNANPSMGTSEIQRTKQSTVTVSMVDVSANRTNQSGGQHDMIELSGHRSVESGAGGQCTCGGKLQEMVQMGERSGGSNASCEVYCWDTGCPCQIPWTDRCNLRSCSLCPNCTGIQPTPVPNPSPTPQPTPVPTPQPTPGEPPIPPPPGPETDPGICTLFGDPHIRVFDDPSNTRMFNIYTYGDYWIVRSNAIKIQGRYGTINPGRNSLVRKLAIGGPFLEGHKLLIGPNNGGSVMWDGVDILTSYPSTFAVDGLIVAEYKNGIVDAGKHSGIEVKMVFLYLPLGVELKVWRKQNFLNTVIKMGAPADGGQTGHCGNFNGDLADDTKQALMQAGIVQLNENLFPTPYTPPQSEQPIEKTVADCPTNEAAAAEQQCLAAMSVNAPQEFLDSCIVDVCFYGADMADQSAVMEDNVQEAQHAILPWPNCQVQDKKILPGTQVLQANLMPYGAKSGCPANDCSDAGEFHAQDVDACATVCYVVAACRSWTFDSNVLSSNLPNCFLHADDSGRTSDVGSSSGTSTCRPPGSCSDVPSNQMLQSARVCAEYSNIDGGSLCLNNPGWRNKKACQYSCYMAGFGYAGDTCTPLTTPPSGACFDQVPSGMINAGNMACSSYNWGVTQCNRCSNPNQNKLDVWQTVKGCAYSCFQAGCGYAGDTCTSLRQLEFGECTDVQTEFMVNAGESCAVHQPVKQCQKCNSQNNPELSLWQAGKFCQYSCYMAGCGYTGDVCHFKAPI